MNQVERLAIRVEIVKAIKHNTAEMTRLRDLSKPVSPDNAIGRITRMDAIQSKSMSEAQLRTVELKLHALEAALLNAEHEDFGLCKMCGSQIQMKRLLFLPESGLCISCAGRRL